MNRTTNFNTSFYRLTIHHRLVTVTMFAHVRKNFLKICALCFGQRNSYKGKKAELLPHPLLTDYAVLFKKYLDGRAKDLSPIPIDVSDCASFEKKVLMAARRIPWGTTVSYGELAKMAGYPKAVRAVASVMRRNRFPLLVPCHRVIRGDGSIGGFMGKKVGRAVDLKRRLLEIEKQYRW